MSDKVTEKATHWKKPVLKHIDTNPAYDKRLHAMAKAIMYYVLSKPKGWKIQVFDLKTYFPKETEYAIRKGLKELAELDFIVLKAFPRVGKEFQGKYYELVNHSIPKAKRIYMSPSFKKITNQNLLDRLYILSWKNEAGKTVYLNDFQLQN